MAPEGQLAWEARVGRPVAAAAFAAGFLPLIGQILGTPTRERKEDRETADFLIGVDDQADRVLAGSFVQAIGFLLLPVVLWFLYRCIRQRNPEFPRAALVASLLGPLVFVGPWLAGQFDLVSVAQDFVDDVPTEVSDKALEDRADDAVDERSGTVGYFVFAGQLITALGFVMIALQAMRVGLTSRFMGWLGVVIGALYGLFGPSGPQIIQLFWLTAMGLLFLGRWPGGRGPAWESGEAEPWPTAAEKYEAQQREQAGEAAGSDGSGDLEAASADPDTPQKEHPSSRKRKRKRRS